MQSHLTCQLHGLYKMALLCGLVEWFARILILKG